MRNTLYYKILQLFVIKTLKNNNPVLIKNSLILIGVICDPTRGTGEGIGTHTNAQHLASLLLKKQLKKREQKT